MISNSRWLHYLLSILIIAVLLFNLPMLQARALFNSAQIARLQGYIQPDLYTRALAHTPDDVHMRWQTGDALAEAGEIAAAADVLLPLADQEDTHEQATGSLLTTLVVAERESEAARAYQTLDTPPDLSPGIAACVLSGFLKDGSDAPPDVTRHLLTNVFGLQESIAAFQPFGERLSAPDFWLTDLGQETRETLQWYTRPVTNTNTGQPTEPNRSLVAEQSGLSAEAIRFGPELVTNGNFEHYDLLNFHEQVFGWRYSFMSQGNPWNLAAFVIGRDSTSPWNGVFSARIDGLYQERDAERQDARAGLWHEGIGIKPDTPYVVSFAYRTQGVQGNVAAVWLTQVSDVFWQNDKLFPPTGGEWKQETIVGWNRSGSETTIYPLLRSWGKGSVWFDDFSIREMLID